MGRALGMRRPEPRERLLEDLVDPSGSCRLSPLHNLEHCWVFSRGVMRPVLSFRTCTSAARVGHGWEGPVRRPGIICTVIAAA